MPPGSRVPTGPAVSLVIEATVNSPGPWTNTATITHADQFDPVASNNTAGVEEIPLRADLEVAKSLDDPAPNVGDLITFTVTVTDDGPDDATNVLVGDLLPAGVSFLAATPSQGSYDAATGVWSVGTITNRTSQTLRITARVTSPAVTTNLAAVQQFDQFDPNTQNNSPTAVVTPRSSDLALTKTVNNPTPTVGATIDYTVTVINQGAGTATGVQVIDRLPAGLVFVASVANQGTYNPVTGVWNVGTINVGSRAVLVVRARIVSTAPQPNLAVITGLIPHDPNPGNNVADVVIRARLSEPPTVTSLKRFGFHAQPTELVLTFSTDLDPARARDASN